MSMDGVANRKEGGKEGGEGRQSEESTRRNFSPSPTSAPFLPLSLSFPPFLLLGHYFIAVERMNSLMHPGGDHPTRMMLLLLLMAMLG